VPPFNVVLQSLCELYYPSSTLLAIPLTRLFLPAGKGLYSFWRQSALFSLINVRVLSGVAPLVGAWVHTHTHTHAHAHTHTNTNVCANTHRCAHTHTHAHTPTHRHTHAHTYTRTNTQAHKRAQTHTCARIHSHAHMHMHANVEHVMGLTNFSASLAMLPHLSCYVIYSSFNC